MTGSPHLLSAVFGAACPLGAKSADKVALDVSQSAQHGNHKSPGAGDDVGP